MLNFTVIRRIWKVYSMVSNESIGIVGVRFPEGFLSANGRDDINTWRKHG